MPRRLDAFSPCCTRSKSSGDISTKCEFGLITATTCACTHRHNVGPATRCRRPGCPATPDELYPRCGCARRRPVPAGNNCRSRHGPRRSAPAKATPSAIGASIVTALVVCRRVRRDEFVAREHGRDFVVVSAPGVHPRPQPAPVQRDGTGRRHQPGQPCSLFAHTPRLRNACFDTTKSPKSPAPRPKAPYIRSTAADARFDDAHALVGDGAGCQRSRRHRFAPAWPELGGICRPRISRQTN